MIATGSKSRLIAVLLGGLQYCTTHWPFSLSVRYTPAQYLFTIRDICGVVEK